MIRTELATAAVKPALTKLREEVSHRVSEAQEAAEAARREIGEAAKRTSDEGTRFVRENPGLALAGALGVGILIGLAVRGRY